VKIIPEEQRNKIASLLTLKPDLRWMNDESYLKMINTENKIFSKLSLGLDDLFREIEAKRAKLTDEAITKIEEKAQSALVEE